MRLKRVHRRDLSASPTSGQHQFLEHTRMHASQERSDGGNRTSLGDFEWLSNCQLARPQPTVVARCVKRGIYRIVVKHFDTLESVELSPEKAALLRSFANFRE